MLIDSQLIKFLIESLSMLITSWATFSVVVLFGCLILKQKPTFRDISWGVAGLFWILSNTLGSVIGRKLDLVEVFIVVSFAISLLPFWHFWIKSYLKEPH